MDRELEALLVTYDAWLQAGPESAQQCQAVFERHLDEVLAHRSNLAKQKLVEALHDLGVSELGP